MAGNEAISLLAVMVQVLRVDLIILKESTMEIKANLVGLVAVVGL
jgi:hypothetical protein